MSYAATNPPSKISNALGSGKNMWIYVSADAKATVVGAGYITNAVQLGMKVGDLVYVFDTATPGGALMCVLTFSTNAANLGYVAVA